MTIRHKEPEQTRPDPIDAYLTQLGRELHTSPEESQDILREIRSHLESAQLEKLRGGQDRATDLTTLLERFGSAKEIGQQLRRVHGRTTWAEAGLAVLPTLLFTVARSALATIIPPPLLIAPLLVIMTLLARRRHWPLWWWAWIGWLPSAIPHVPNEFTWTMLLYIVLLALVIRRDWLKATLAIYPLPTFWAFQTVVLSSSEVQAASWGAKALIGLSAAISVVWAVLLIRTLRVPSGIARINRALESQGTIVLLNVLIVVAARMWPTHPSPYPFTLGHFVRFTLPYSLFRGPPFLLFSLLTTLPALLALMQSQARRRPPSRRAWSG